MSLYVLLKTTGFLTDMKWISREMDGWLGTVGELEKKDRDIKMEKVLYYINLSILYHIGKV